MQKELSYTTAEGFTVFTSHYLKNRGTCCKSACVHCPYGYTLKKLGLQFKQVTEAEYPTVEAILYEDSQNQHHEWKNFLPDNIRLILIKDQIAGFMLKNHIVIKHVVLKPHFQNQNLSKELIESYFFI